MRISFLLSFVPSFAKLDFHYVYPLYPFIVPEVVNHFTYENLIGVWPYVSPIPSFMTIGCMAIHRASIIYAFRDGSAIAKPSTFVPSFVKLDFHYVYPLYLFFVPGDVILTLFITTIMAL